MQAPFMQADFRFDLYLTFSGLGYEATLAGELDHYGKLIHDHHRVPGHYPL